MSKPWHRRPKETPQAFEAFRNYLEEGTLQKATRRTYPKLSKKVPIASTISRWSVQHDWVTRRTAYVDHIYEQRDEAIVNTVRQEGADWARVRLENDERLARAGSQLLDRIEEMVRMPAVQAQDRVVEERYEDGRPHVTRVRLEPMRWTAGSIPDLMRMIVEVNESVLDRYIVQENANQGAEGEDALLAEFEVMLEEAEDEEADAA